MAYRNPAVRGLAALLFVSACGGAPAPHHAAASVAPRPSPSPVPAPTHSSVTLPQCPKPMGGTVELRDRASGASLRLSVGQPSFSTTSLSRDYGEAPRNGFYLTVAVRLVATGDQPVTIGPDDFYVQQGGRRTSINDGNSEYSGASQALGTTAADPGETVTGPLTFDVPERHGLVVYAPSNRSTCSWRF